MVLRCIDKIRFMVRNNMLMYKLNQLYCADCTASDLKTILAGGEENVCELAHPPRRGAGR